MSKQTSESRDGFQSRFGFILACIGSAVGMGCIWLFPYRVGQYGGFAFLVPFLIFVIGLGFCGVIGEMAFGRAMGTALSARLSKRWSGAASISAAPSV